MSVWIIVLREWEKIQINTEIMWTIWRWNNEGAPWTTNYKSPVSTIYVTGLRQWAHSAVGFHRYTHLLSRNIINLNGKCNVFVTLLLYKFVNISIGMGPNENWWRRKYMSDCQCMYVYLYMPHHFYWYDLWSHFANKHINVLNLLVLENITHTATFISKVFITQ